MESRGARAWRWLREHAVNIVAALVVWYRIITPLAQLGKCRADELTWGLFRTRLLILWDTC